MSQFGPAYIIGMENPHLGWLTEEIEEVDRKAVQGLAERGLIGEITEQEVEIDDALLSMVEACVHPEHSLIVYSQTEDGKGKERYIHFAQDRIVEHIESESNIHCLTAFENRAALTLHLKDDLRLASKTSSSSQSFYLPEEVLLNTSRLYADGKAQEGNAVLQKSNLYSTIIQTLDNVLTEPIANSSFVVLVNQNNPNTQHVRGFGILEGKDEFWLMCPTERMGQPQVEFTPANAEIAHQRFIEILP